MSLSLAQARPSFLPHEFEMRERGATRLDDDKAPLTTSAQPHCIDGILNQSLNTLPLMRAIDLAHPKLRRLAGSLAFAHVVVFLSVLVYFITVETQAELSRQYLSLTDPGSGVAKCNDVPVPMTALYTADVNGLWDTQRDYVEAKGIFDLNMVGTTVNTKQYSKALGKLADSLYAAGERASANNGDVFSTLLVASLFSERDADTDMTLSMRVDFNALAKQIAINAPSSVTGLNRPWFSSASGVCVPAVALDFTAMISPSDLQLSISLPRSFSTSTSGDRGGGSRSLFSLSETSSRGGGGGGALPSKPADGSTQTHALASWSYPPPKTAQTQTQTASPSPQPAPTPPLTLALLGSGARDRASRATASASIYYPCSRPGA